MEGHQSSVSSSRAAPKAEAQGQVRPCVVLDRDTAFYRVRLSTVLKGAQIDVFVAHPESVEKLVGAMKRVPDLVVHSLQSGLADFCVPLRDLRATPGLEHMPILAIVGLHHSGLDLEELRALGVIGLVDKTATPEQILYRVNQIVRTTHFRRRHERAPVFFPVDVEALGSQSSEYAIDLSPGGMRVTSECPIPENTEVRVYFCLGAERISAGCRVAHCQRGPTAAIPYQVGLFFTDIDPRLQDAIGREVARALAKLEAAMGKPDGP